VITKGQGMADLTLPIIALIGAFGYYLSNPDKEAEKLTETTYSNVDGISRNELPTGQTIYSSNMVYDAEKQVYDKMKSNYVDSMNPSETNIIPPIYNTYNTRGHDNTNDTLNVNNNRLASEYNEMQRLTNVKRSSDASPESNISTAPMFKETSRKESTSYTRLEDTLGGQEVSLLTGELLDKRHNNMVPFFGGVVKQNMEKFTNTTKLGLHTGETDTYFKKQEIASLYDKAEENIYGSATFTTQVESDRFVPSYYRTNEAPAEKEYISAQKAGTFENNIRPVFRDVNELRVKSNPKLVYKGRNNHGQVASTRGLTGPVEKNNAETVWDWGIDRWNKTTGDFKGHQKYENYEENMKYTNRLDSDEYYGQVNNMNGTSEGYVPLKGQNEQTTLQSGQREGFGNTQTSGGLETIQQYAKRSQHIPGDNAYRNVGGENITNNASDYGKSGYNGTTIPETQRDSTQKTNILNVKGQGTISTSHFMDTAKTTIKDSTNYAIKGLVSTDFNSGAVGAVESGAANYEVKTVQKESIIKNKYEQGIRHKDYGLGYTTQNYIAETTNKELVTADKKSDYRGGAGGDINHPKNRQDTDNAQIRTRQEELLMNEKKNGPQNFNTRSGKGVVNITNNDNKLFTEMENTVKLNIEPRQTAPTKEFLGEFDKVKASAKSSVDEQWSRLDSSIYDQLNDNPFVNNNMRAYNNSHVDREMEKSLKREFRLSNAPKTSLPDNFFKK
jgi:hypothetical protein